jgi:hypothetical protein
MKKLLFALALLLPLLGHAEPETVRRRFLLDLEREGRHMAYAVVDAAATKDGEKYLQWILTATYYLPSSPGIVTRHYGSSVGNRAGEDNLAVELRPNSVVLTVPTPGGDHGVPLIGSLGADGKWTLSGSATFAAGDAGAGKGKAKGRKETWTVRSVHSIQLKGIDLRD